MKCWRDKNTQTSPEQVRTALETIVREERGRVLAALVAFLRDLQLAEDVLQDACVAALRHWPEDGVPDHPRAWLLRTARHRAIDRFRREANFKSKRSQLQVLAELERLEEQEGMDETIPDERLRLIFICCHPALAEWTRVALTLRTLGGLTTTEIARAFLVPEATMAQRIVRAKRKIKAANIPYNVPPPHLWPERLGSVLSVIYLIFNEGYAASSGSQPARTDLCQEAIRLGEIMLSLVPQEPEAAGLLALMLLHDSRRQARTSDTGDLVTLEHQDRGLWNRRQIDAGAAHLQRALAMGRVGAYQVQAAISATHAQAAQYGDTDWNEIVLLYGKLFDLQPSPVVQLNAAAALSMAQGTEAGLSVLTRLEQQGELEQYQPFHATRADLLRRADRREEAAEAYRRALELTRNASEKDFLLDRLRNLLD